MAATTTIRIGQLWADPDGALALITTAGERNAYLRYVSGPREAEVVHVAQAVLASEWRYRSENARLRCLDPDATLTAARFLTDHGVRDVLVDDDTVSAPLNPRSILDFAEDALANGWAHDNDCARMIGDLG